jgi:carbon monoxide dehydrogenase subunit G
MDMTGERRIPAPRQVVWQKLNDPEVLKASIPGCESLEKLSDTEMKATVSVKIGPISARFTGTVHLSDIDPPNGYMISGEGQGGVAGFAKGGAKVDLAEDGAATVLTYTVQAQVGGKLAQIGSRLVDGVARKMANDFFGCFATAVAAEEPAPAAAEAALGETASAVPIAKEEPVAVETSPPMPTPGPATARLPPAVWVTGLAVIVILLLYFFTGHDATR